MSNSADQQKEIAQRSSNFGMAVFLEALEDEYRDHHQPVVALDCTRSFMPTRNEGVRLAKRLTANRLLRAQGIPTPDPPESHVVCLHGFRTFLFRKKDDGAWACRRAFMKHEVSASTLADLIQHLCDHPEELDGDNFIH